MPRLLLAALVLALAGCDSIALWLTPNVTCADWQIMPEANRSAYTDQLVRAGADLEAIRVAHRAPADTPDDLLLAFVVSSINKNCDLKQWSPTVSVKELFEGMYPPVGS